MGRFCCVALASVLLLGSGLMARESAGRAQGAGDSVSAAIDAAFKAAYNLDIADALATARRAVALGPDRSAAHRAVAAIIWLEILLRRGTVTIDHYLGGSVTRSQLNLPKPPADLDAEFKHELGLAIDLAEKKLLAMPDDIQARFEVGAV